MGRRVLLVEDETDVRQPIAELLARAGFEVETAANGLEALRIARTAPPDVIVLDLVMPVMNGWELLQVKRTDPHLEGIPVVVMSASSRERVAGAARQLDKPFDAAALVRAVGELASGAEIRALRE